MPCQKIWIPPRQFGNVNGDAWREKTVFMEGDGPDGLGCIADSTNQLYTHTIHVWYEYLPTFGGFFMGNVGKYTSPMDAKG